MVTAIAAITASACIRGTLPAREYYRLTPAQASAAPAAGAPAPLEGGLVIVPYRTPGIYANDGIVFRVAASRYGVYPSREWAIPLGEMLGSLTEPLLVERRLTSDPAVYDASSRRREAYEWRGAVTEFDEVDERSRVSVAVALSARLVRTSDDSVLWTGRVRETEGVTPARSMDAVVRAMSAAASRAIGRLAEDASAQIRRLAASGAQEH